MAGDWPSTFNTEEDKGRMLIATNYAKKMAADMRLIPVAVMMTIPKIR